MPRYPRTCSISSSYGSIAWCAALVALLILVGSVGLTASAALAQENLPVDDVSSLGDDPDDQETSGELQEEDSTSGSEELSGEDGAELIRELGYQNTPAECEGVTGSRGSVDPDDIDDECLAALGEAQGEEPEAGEEDSGGQDEGSGGQEEGAGDQQQEEDDSGGFLGIDSEGIGLSIFQGILDWIYEHTVERTAETVAGLLTGSAFTLPPPEGPMVDSYNQLVETVRPGVVVALLILALMMMFQPANYNVAYATQNALPKIFVVMGGLVFFPEIMTIFSDLTSGIANTFIDRGDIEDTLLTLTTNQMASLAGLGFLGFLVSIAVVIMSILVVVVAVLKSFLFALFFMVGPLALILYPVPGLSGITGSWFRGVLACFMIPVLYSIQMGLGFQAIAAPEAIFGDMGSIPFIESLLVVILMWIMWKTPFKVIEWAFYGYRAGGGLMSTVAKGALVGAAGRYIVGSGGGASGAGGTSGSGPSQRLTDNRTVRDKMEKKTVEGTYNFKGRGMPPRDKN